MSEQITVSLLSGFFGVVLGYFLETLKHRFQKKAIAFQIHKTEFVKAKFSRIEELHSSLLDFDEFMQNKLNWNKPEKFKECRDSFYNNVYKVKNAFQKCMLYIDSSAVDLKTCYKSFILNSEQILLLEIKADNQGKYPGDWSKYDSDICTKIEELKAFSKPLIGNLTTECNKLLKL